MTDKAFLEAVFLLFGRKLAKVPPFPANNDGIKFNFATLQWELSPFGGAGEANTSSNVGAGLGWALPKVGVDLPFKSFIATSPLSLVSAPTTITIQSNIPFILGIATNGSLPAGIIFFAFFTNGRDATEFDSQGFLGFAFRVKKITLHVGTNTSDNNVIFVMRDDGVDVPNTTITVPSGTTGDFDTGAISELIGANSLINMSINRVGSSTFDDWALMVECEKV